MVWKEYKTDPNRVYSWHIGEYVFYVKGEGKEFKLFNEKVKPSSSITYEPMGKDVFTDDNTWKSFISGKTGSILLLPSMPDRPLVIKTGHDLLILPGKSIILYALIPVWVKFYSGTESEQDLLAYLPSIDQSSTWFGDTDNGVLSYSLYNPVIFSIEGIEWSDYEVLCPIKIINDSNQALKVERLSLDVSQLRIYCTSNGKLVSNEVHFKYRGGKTASDINFAKTAPKEVKDAKLLVREIDPSAKNLLKRGIDFIKTGTTL